MYGVLMTILFRDVLARAPATTPADALRSATERVGQMVGIDVAASSARGEDPMVAADSISTPAASV